jgi:molybdate transport system regulatory protein
MLPVCVAVAVGVTLKDIADMSLVWAICGAGRGVGKTTLAQNLKNVLPRSVYAKCGCGSIKRGKPPTFFKALSDLCKFVEGARGSEKHIIVESNSFAKAGNAAITICIDAKPSQDASVRADTPQLRRCADIVICRHADTGEWMDVLSKSLSSKSLAKRVLEALLGQQQYLFGSNPEFGFRLWFAVGGQHVFGRGLAQLFTRVDELGTLQEAAKAEKMSYRYAWEMVRKAERHLGKTLLVRRAGGRGGGDSQLSPDGRLLLEAFQRLSDETSAFLHKRFGELYDFDASRP